MPPPAERSSVDGLDSGFVKQGGELSLSNLGQLELLRATSERGAPLRTTVRGFSMHPFIRDEDVLTIAPMNGRIPKLGEVVAFTHPETGRLVIHRVIACGQASFLLRGDNCPKTDGLVPGENIIGRVTRLEREGKELRLGLGLERCLIALLNRGNLLMQMKWLWYMPRRVASLALSHIQNLKRYRTIGRHMVPRFSILEADENDLFALHRRINPNLAYKKQPKNPNVTNWAARYGERTIGFVQYVYHPEANYPWVGHWLFSLDVFGPYRGLGVGEALTQRVIQQAMEQEAAELLLVVNEDNIKAIRLYEKLGFQQSTVDALEPLLKEEERLTGRRRIVMRRSFLAASID